MKAEQLPRDDDGRLTRYAWPGGYPLMYLDGNGQTLCGDCARDSDEDDDELDTFKPCGWGVLFDSESMITCDNCSKEI